MLRDGDTEVFRWVMARGGQDKENTLMDSIMSATCAENRNATLEFDQASTMELKVQKDKCGEWGRSRVHVHKDRQRENSARSADISPSREGA